VKRNRKKRVYHGRIKGGVCISCEIPQNNLSCSTRTVQPIRIALKRKRKRVCLYAQDIFPHSRLALKRIIISLWRCLRTINGEEMNIGWKKEDSCLWWENIKG